MPAHWTVRSVQPNNGLIKVHLTRDVHGQPEEILLNVIPDMSAQAFMEGDLRDAVFPLIARAGRNGKDRV
jgi:hypothetical protein